MNIQKLLIGRVIHSRSTIALLIFVLLARPDGPSDERRPCTARYSTDSVPGEQTRQECF